MTATDPLQPLAIKLMNLTLLTSLMVFAATAGAADERSCVTQDDDLLECPAVAAPLVTELREGFVVLAFTVRPDGSVNDIQLLESGGDQRWIDAAVATVSRWKYRTSNRSVQKTQRFTFEFEG
jgi:TonB family protein